MRAKLGPSLWDSQEFSVSPLILISGGHMALTQRWVFSFFWGPGEGELLHFLSLACSTNSQASFPCMFLVQPCVLWSQFTLTNLEGGILSAFRNNVSVCALWMSLGRWCRLHVYQGSQASSTCKMESNAAWKMESFGEGREDHCLMQCRETLGRAYDHLNTERF